MSKRYVQFEYFDLGIEQDLKFKGVAYSGSVVYDPFFQEYTIVDVESLKLSPRAEAEGMKIPILWAHDHRDPIGHGFITKENGKVIVEGELYGDQGEKLYGMMKKDFPMEQSIGFYTDLGDEVEIPKGETKSINNMEVSAPVKVLYNSTLKEVSLVSLGADPNTEARVFSAVKDYKPEKGAKKMSKKKEKAFADCNCEEQKKQSKSIVEKIEEIKMKYENDTELGSVFGKVQSVFEGLNDLIDRADQFNAKAKESEEKNTVIEELSAANEALEVQVAEFSTEADTAKKSLQDKIQDEKIEKLEAAYGAHKMELTGKVKSAYLSMNEEQFTVAIDALKTDGKSFLFNHKNTGKGTDDPKSGFDYKKIAATARDIRKEYEAKGQKLPTQEYHKLARKKLGYESE